MGTPRRAVLALLLAGLLVLASAPVLHAGTRDAPEINDPAGDAQTIAGQAVDWADVVAVWVVRNGTDLTFNMAVTSLENEGESQDNGAQWNLEFQADGVPFRARWVWEGTTITAQLDQGGAALGGEDVEARIEGTDTLVFEWRGFDDQFDRNATLTRPFAYVRATASPQTLTFETVDCPGTDSPKVDDAIDCAPDEGFGADAEAERDIATFLDVEVSPDNATLERGDQATFDLRVNSTAEDDVNATLATLLPEGFSAVFDNASMVVPSTGEVVNRTLTLTAGATVQTNATHNVTVVLSPEGGNNITRVVTVTVPAPPPPPPPYALRVSISPTSATVAPGESVVHTVNVTNDGTRQDTVDVELVAGPGWASLDRTAAILNPGQSVQVQMTVRVPQDAEERQVGHQVRATSRNDPGNATATAFAITDVSFEGGFYEQLDRQLAEMGLGGVIPLLLLIIIVLVVLVYVLIPYLRRRQVVGVEPEWVEDEEVDEDAFGPREDEEGEGEPPDGEEAGPEEGGEGEAGAGEPAGDEDVGGDEPATDEESADDDALGTDWPDDDR